jgi:hypothetical protein
MAAGSRVFCLLPLPLMTGMSISWNSFVGTFYGLCLIAMDMLCLLPIQCIALFIMMRSLLSQKNVLFFIAMGHVKLTLAIIARLVGGFTPVKSTRLHRPKSAVSDTNDSDVNC